MLARKGPSRGRIAGAVTAAGWNARCVVRVLLVVVTALVLVGAGSCGDKGVQDEERTQGLETPTSEQEATPAPALASLETVTGTAENAKGGAVIVEDGGRVIYVAGLDSWPDEVHTKAVRAVGKLVEKQYLPVATVAPDGAISQGTAGGDQWVLEDADWSLAAPPPGE